MPDSIKYVIVGFVIGILSGLLGVGGGVFLVPVMVSLFAIPQHTAHGTSLAVVIPTAIVSSIIYGTHGNIDLGIALNLLVGSVIGANIGARVMKKIPASRLKQIFGVMLFLVGLRMVLG